VRRIKVFISGLGVVSPIGVNFDAIRQAIQSQRHGFKALDLFEAGQAGPLPVGQVPDLALSEGLPRTHSLALAAARQALGAGAAPPDALVLGGTTGGIPTSEELLLEKQTDSERFRLHGTGTVATWLAAELGCTGPAMTISTACSSSAAALRLALELLRSGRYQGVLAGGADALCRLTYYGFGLLQLIDPTGARPLDADRAGMTVAEGAALLLLEAADEPPDPCYGQLLGAGLSCDAHHATAPHPEGLGALSAMRRALADGGLAPEQIDYVNLHGTGTRDNDASEARALHGLFTSGLPAHSSTKGIFGHSLAAAGALEACVALAALGDGCLPPNAGCKNPDPELGLNPVLRPVEADLNVVLSNSLGFGGNNAAVIYGRADRPGEGAPLRGEKKLSALAVECLTGAGFLDASWARLQAGESCAGCYEPKALVADLPPRSVRRIKRLPRMALALLQSLERDATRTRPGQVFFGTGWGPLSETADFLTRLFSSQQRLSSPTDFVGSVHNAPAGQLAMRLGAKGANVVSTCADTSFEQALYMASLLMDPADGSALLMGADEFHQNLSPILDPAAEPVDGGGAIELSADPAAEGSAIRPVFLGRPATTPEGIAALIEALGGAAALAERVGAIWLGGAGERADWRNEIGQALGAIAVHAAPVVDYRAQVGAFASASAIACALAVRAVQSNMLPTALAGGEARALNGRSILVVTAAEHLACVEVGP
jgi:3-oxoacyl-(acyl-carrier-protein) synthase